MTKNDLDAIYRGAIPWSGLEYIAINEVIKDSNARLATITDAHSVLDRVLAQRYANPVIRSSHSFRFEALTRFVGGRRQQLLSLGLAQDDGLGTDSSFQMSLALIETLCVSRYQVDIRTVRNPPRTFSIFPDNILEVAARLFRDGELKPPADLN